MGFLKELALFCTIHFLVVVVIGEEDCKVMPTCSCMFGEDEVKVQEQVNSSEALAGAVGALGSLVVAGSGFGLWHFLKSRKGPSRGGLLDRTSSDLSNDSIDRRGSDDPPPYKDRTNPAFENMNDNRPMKQSANVYRAGIQDDVNMRVGDRTVTPGHYNRGASDW